jgi:hypothetical protein
MPKVEEFNHIYNKDGAQRNHNFRHFRSFFPPPIFGGLAHLGLSALFIGLKLYHRVLIAGGMR